MNRLDRDLLWKAWPSGHLAKCGVSTVDGWMCTGVIETSGAQGGPGSLWQLPVQLDANGNIRWVEDSETCGDDPGGLYTLFVPDSLIVIKGTEDARGIDQWLAARRKGDLLPLVDPRATATWACLLTDLAEAFGWPQDGAALFWRLQCMSDGTHEDAWQLVRGLVLPDAYGYHTGRMKTIYVGQGTEDPALALVLARAQLRKADVRGEKA